MTLKATFPPLVSSFLALSIDLFTAPNSRFGAFSQYLNSNNSKILIDAIFSLQKQESIGPRGA